MKTILILVLFSVSIQLYSLGQTAYPLSKYKMYSEIWKAELYDYDNNSTVIGPKEGGVFTYDLIYLNQVDIKKVQAHLEKSFNDFRKSYNLKPAKVDKTLMKECVDDAKNMNQKTGIFKNDNKYAKQFWDKIPLFCFGHVNTKKIDINKAIADSFFDYLVGDDEGMSLLLDNSNKNFGFGISYNEKDYGFYVVVKSMKPQNPKTIHSNI